MDQTKSGDSIYADSIALSEEDIIWRCKVETSVGAAVPATDVCVRTQSDMIGNWKMIKLAKGFTTCLAAQVFGNGAWDQACSRQGHVAPPSGKRQLVFYHSWEVFLITWVTLWIFTCQLVFSCFWKFPEWVEALRGLRYRLKVVPRPWHHLDKGSRSMVILRIKALKYLRALLW